MRWVGFLLWCLMVFALSSIPGNATPTFPRFEHADKVVHFGLFFLGAFLLTDALRATVRWSPVLVIVFVALVMSGVGALDEWYQLHTPGRSGADVGDWIADTAGGIFGAVTLYAMHGIVRFVRREKPGAGTPRADRAG